MSLSVLAQGTLASDPQERTSAAGKTYCTALLRVPVDGEESMLASLIAFEATAVKALMQLHKGDPVSVAGMGKLTQWTGKDGLEKRGLSVTVQAVLSIYQARKRRREGTLIGRRGWSMGCVGYTRSSNPSLMKRLCRNRESPGD